MVALGSVGPEDFVWHEGLTEWQPLNSVFDFGESTSQQPVFASPVETPKAILTNVKQGALIGGVVCFGLGLLFMAISLFLIFIYGPLFLAAFVLSIVAMAQRRIWGGVSLLMATLIIPTTLWFTLFAKRSADFLAEQGIGSSAAATQVGSGADSGTNAAGAPASISDALKQSFERSAREAELKALEELRTRKSAYGKLLDELKTFKVVSAAFRKDKDGLAGSTPVIELTVKNETSFPVKRAYFRGVLSTAGRSVPWVDETFNYSVAGGLESGEKVTWNLSPNMFSEWGTVDAPADANFEVTVTRLDGPDDKPLFGDTYFTKADQDRLDELEKKYAGQSSP
jgi:hypothetical protein